MQKFPKKEATIQKRKKCKKLSSNFGGANELIDKLDF